MKTWILWFVLAAPSHGEAAVPPDPEPAAAPLILPNPAPPASRELLIGVVRELLAQLTPLERSRFFERHPELRRMVAWKEPPPSPRLVSADLEPGTERERREAEYHIRPAEAPAVSTSAASAEGCWTEEDERARRSAQLAETLMDRMLQGFPDEDRF